MDAGKIVANLRGHWADPGTRHLALSMFFAGLTIGLLVAAAVS